MRGAWLLGTAAAAMISASTIACSDPVWPDVDVELRGIVTDSATLAVIPGATVGLYRADGLSRATRLGATTTDAAGSYVLRVRVDRCTATIIALGVSANGYIDALRGYVGEPLDQNPQCRSQPQTFDFALQARSVNSFAERGLTNVAADKHFSDAATPQW